jgi:uncharacterized membrane protein
MLHPAIAHFAIVLPVVASVFGIMYLATRKELLGKISSVSIFLAALAMVGAWYTGNQTGPEIYDYLSEAGQQELVEHKNLGLYLAIVLSLLSVLKLLGWKLNKFRLEAVAIVLLLIVTATALVQGKDGGELVYKHGTPFKSFSILETLNDAALDEQEEDHADSKLEVYQDALEDIKLHSNEVDKLYE